MVVVPEDQYYDSDEFGEEAPCLPLPEIVPPEVDWDAAFRAVATRNRVDPRFRWRISRWKNLCPVALKNGNSVVGKPELAHGLNTIIMNLAFIYNLLCLLTNI